MTDLCRDLPNIGLTLAIINEYDMVSRADRSYIRSVVDLYRSSHGLPPVLSGTATESYEGADTFRGSSATKSWPLPTPRYNLVGDIIVLRLRLSGVSMAPVDDAFSQTSTLTAPIVEAVKVTPEKFAKLLFCDLAAHRRRAYVERMDFLTAQMCESPGNGKLPEWVAGFYGSKKVG